MNCIAIAATLAAAGAVAWPRVAAAQEPTNDPDTHDRSPPAACMRLPDANVVVRCALEASPEVREARAHLDEAAARRATAGVLLPSNPTLAGTASNRRRPPPEQASVLNWSVAVSQEVELGGQRRARIERADAATDAQARRVKVAEQEVGAAALTAYYEALASQDTLRFATQLAGTAQALATYADARAKEALVAGVEADVARAEAARIGLTRLESERRLSDARAALAVLLNVDPQRLAFPEALPAGPPPPLPSGALEDQALSLRGEVSAAALERRVLERQLALVRRERVPNPTISAFFERGEINDRIIGVGLSIPIPLPSPVGRTRAGEIAETLAQLRAAESSQELVRRRVRLEVARAVSGFQSRNAEAALFGADLVARAHADLAALREAIGSGQLTLREGLQWQRSLIELLQADIGARLARALAWVELRRVVGLPLSSVTGGGR